MAVVCPPVLHRPAGDRVPRQLLGRPAIPDTILAGNVPTRTHGGLVKGNPFQGFGKVGNGHLAQPAVRAAGNFHPAP
jgi:hypothetical protein